MDVLENDNKDNESDGVNKGDTESESDSPTSKRKRINVQSYDETLVEDPEEGDKQVLCMYVA